MSEWLLIKRQQTASVGKGMENRELLGTGAGNVNWGSQCGKQY